jgi:hypothetical protein
MAMGRRVAAAGRRSVGALESAATYSPSLRSALADLLLTSRCLCCTWSLMLDATAVARRSPGLSGSKKVDTAALFPLGSAIVPIATSLGLCREARGPT